MQFHIFQDGTAKLYPEPKDKEMFIRSQIYNPEYDELIVCFLKNILKIILYFNTTSESHMGMARARHESRFSSSRCSPYFNR